jgi:tetratricopeptide (TPR) repeat protein
VSEPFTPGGVILGGVFSPTEPLVALITSHPSLREVPDYPPWSAVKPGVLHLWEWQAGKERCPGIELPGEPRGVDFAPDGKAIAVLCSSGQVMLLDPATGAQRRTRQVRPANHANNWYFNNGALVYGPGGRTLWTFSTENRVRVLDADTLEEKYPPLEHKGLVSDVCFSPDGRLASTASWDNAARVWDVATGKPLCEPLPHPDWVFRAPFSPDGTKLLTACRDSTARLWDWRQGREVLPALEHNHEVHAVAFTPDGRRLLTAGDDNTARLWDARSGKPLSKPLDLPSYGLQAQITRDGRHAVVCGFTPRIQVIDLESLFRTDGLSGDDLVVWGELISGKRLQDVGQSNLTAAEWERRWQEFTPRHPELLQVPEADQLATHRREAQESLQARQWSSAFTHLTALLEVSPRDQSLLLRHGRALAELGRFEEAYADYKNAWDQANMPAYEIHRLVLLALACKDRSGAGPLIDKWIRSTPPQDLATSASVIVWTYVLEQDISVNKAQLEELVSRDAAFESRWFFTSPRDGLEGTAFPPWFRNLSPATPYLLRTGRVEEAWDRLQKELPALPASRKEINLWSANPFPEPHCFLALLHARRGNRTEAEAELEKARTYRQNRMKRTEPTNTVLGQEEDPDAPWNVRLMRSLLLAEAERAVKELRP